MGKNNFEKSLGKGITPEIAIIGAGAIGSLIGGMLAHCGENVRLIGPKAHVAAIRTNGLIVDGAKGEFTVHPKAAQSLDAPPDVVFIAVKNQDVERTCKGIAPWVVDRPVVMMQNGMRAADTAASIFDRRHIISASLMLNARFLEPGRVTYIKPGPIVMGHAFGPNGKRAEQIQSILKKGFKTKISHNIQGVQWTKLFINALGNALDGMTGMPMGEYKNYPELWRIGASILREALDLMDRAGIRMAPLPGIPIALLKMMIRTPLPVAARLLKLVTTAKGDKQIVTSTLQSLLKAKTSEIDYLNGEFVRLGKRLSMSTPVNSKVVELIHAIERTHQFYTPHELAVEFGLSKR